MPLDRGRGSQLAEVGKLREQPLAAAGCRRRGACPQIADRD